MRLTRIGGTTPVHESQWRLTNWLAGIPVPQAVRSTMARAKASAMWEKSTEHQRLAMEKAAADAMTMA